MATTSPRVLRAIYRCALRNAAHFDRHPAMKVLLSRDPDLTPAADSLEVDAALQRFLGSSGFYVPATPRPRSAAEAVRAAFRAPREGREADLDQGMRAMRLLQRALNAAAALKLLPTHRVVPSPRAAAAAGVTQDAAPDGSRWALLPPATARAAPAASPLLPLAAPARGVLLLSHPRLGDYFHRKVILLLEHDDSGARGVVLNARTRTRCGTLLKAPHRHVEQEWLSKGPLGRRRRASYLALSRAANRVARVMAELPAAAAAVKAIGELDWGSNDKAEAPASFDASASDDEVDLSDLSDHDDDDEAVPMPAGWNFERVDKDAEDLEKECDGMVRRAKAMDAQSTSMGLLASESGQPLLHRCSRHGVYNGGPVPGGTVLHSCSGVDGTLLLGAGEDEGGAAGDDVAAQTQATGAGGGVYLGGDMQRLTALVGTKSLRRRHVRFFAGEAVWSSGQLAGEVARGEWLIASAAPDWVLGPAATATGGCMWQRAMRALGGEHAAMAALPPTVGRDEDKNYIPYSVRVQFM